jgi:CheY-like chemotaxis protein
MTDSSERRQGPDRRSRPRGGRRTTDPSGYSPLVLVVDRDTHGRETCEAILAKLRFAVAPVESPEKALSIMAALKPDIVVVRDSDAALLRGISAPLVVMKPSQDPLALIEEIRRALRAMPRR